MYAVVVAFFISCNTPSGPVNETSQDIAKEETSGTVRDGVFIHISEGYNNPHRVLMPFKMATMMSADKDVLVYLDIEAVKLVTQSSEDVVMDGFESLQTYLAKLKEAGVGVYACPSCLNVAGFAPDDLLDGVETAQKDKFFNFTQGRIITLDY